MAKTTMQYRIILVSFLGYPTILQSACPTFTPWEFNQVTAPHWGPIDGYNKARTKAL